MSLRCTVAGVLVLACIQCACAPDRSSTGTSASKTDNTVAAFLKSAERQAETDEQRRAIQAALRDMLEKSPEDLRQARYPDYTGKPNAWSITELLPRYFVPNPPVALDEQRFFKDVRAPEARAAVKYQLDELNRVLK